MRAGLPWFRLYAELIDDPKCQRLSPALFKTWINLLCLACQAGGRLPSIDDMAFRLRLSVHDAESQLSDLIMAGLIDIDSTGARFPHNWPNRQFVSDNSTLRVRAHRKRKELWKRDRNNDETLHETAPDSDSDPDSDSKSTAPPPTTSRRPRAVARGGEGAGNDVEGMIERLRREPRRIEPVELVLAPLLRLLRFDAPSPEYALGELADWLAKRSLDEASACRIVRAVLDVRRVSFGHADIMDAVRSLEASPKASPSAPAGVLVSRKSTPEAHSAWIARLDRAPDHESRVLLRLLNGGAAMMPSLLPPDNGAGRAGMAANVRVSA